MLGGLRGKGDEAIVDYDIDVKDGRERASVFANAAIPSIPWCRSLRSQNQSGGKLMADKGVGGIFRAANGKTRMGTDALPHEGLGVAQYAWSSLRCAAMWIW